MTDQDQPDTLALQLAAKRTGYLARAAAETARGVLKSPAGLTSRRELIDRIAELEAELGRLRGTATLKTTTATPTTTRPATTRPATSRPAAVKPLVAPSRTTAWDQLAALPPGPERTRFYRTHRRELDRERNANS